MNPFVFIIKALLLLVYYHSSFQIIFDGDNSFPFFSFHIEGIIITVVASYCVIIWFNHSLDMKKKYDQKEYELIEKYMKENATQQAKHQSEPSANNEVVE